MLIMDSSSPEISCSDFQSTLKGGSYSKLQRAFITTHINCAGIHNKWQLFNKNFGHFVHIMLCRQKKRSESLSCLHHICASHFFKCFFRTIGKTCPAQTMLSVEWYISQVPVFKNMYSSQLKEKSFVQHYFVLKNCFPLYSQCMDRWKSL